MAASDEAALKVGIPLYPGFDTLDVLGPFQTFTFAGMDGFLVAPDLSLVTSWEGVAIQPTATFADCPQLDVLFVPGAADPVPALLAGRPGANPLLDFLIAQAEGANLVCSVCTGAILLAGAGLLDDCLATTHWAFKDMLRLFPCTVVDDYRRYVQSGNRITGAGIAAGLDEALYIVSLLYGVGVARHGQLAMQYHPQPILNCGDPDDVDIQDEPGMVQALLDKWQVAQSTEQVANWLAG
jgi:transcriptional regulator GlxA family with amidase domain